MTHGFMNELPLGFDSLVLCVGAGSAWRARPSSLLPVAAAFGAADGGAQLLGAMSGHALLAPFIALSPLCPFAIAVYGVFVLLASRRISAGATRPWLLMALSIPLGVDNFVAGAASNQQWAAAVTGAAMGAGVTASMALIGCAIGLMLGRSISPSPRFSIGSAVCRAVTNQATGASAIC